VQATSALAEVLWVAENAGVKHSGLWDYSRRLGAEEEMQVGDLIKFTSRFEDNRSVSLSANIEYKGSRYTLTLSAAKKTTQPCNQPAASPQVFYPRALAEILQRIEKERIYCNKLVFCLTYCYGD
jgi:hypothetical protein